MLFRGLETATFPQVLCRFVVGNCQLPSKLKGFDKLKPSEGVGIHQAKQNMSTIHFMDEVKLFARSTNAGNRHVRKGQKSKLLHADEKRKNQKARRPIHFGQVSQARTTTPTMVPRKPSQRRLTQIEQQTKKPSGRKSLLLGGNRFCFPKLEDDPVRSLQSM